MLNYSASRKFSKKELVHTWLQEEDLDLNLVSSLVSENAELGPEAVLKDSKYNPILTPFELKWVFGSDATVGVLNLTTDTNKLIFYAATNVGVLYDYCRKSMTIFRGHESKIVSISIDRTGKWLATADSGPDNSIMIWNVEKASLVWSIFNHPPAGYDLILVGLSPNAKLLVTVSNQGENSVDFWLWTYGEENPHDTYTDERSQGAPKSIEFHPNKEDHIMVVFEKSVFFFIWNYQQKKLLKSVNPKSSQTSAIGHYTDGTYVEKCNEAFVATSKGCILVFGTTIFSKQYALDELDNDKFYVKTIKTSKGQINCITTVDSLLVTGDSYGNVMFFDKRVKLLYWWSNDLSKSIRSISFRLTPRKVKMVQVEEEEKEEEEGEEEEGDEIIDCDRSVEYEKLMLDQLPTDATLQNRPFITRDFFIRTSDSTIYAMNFLKHLYTPIFPTSDSNVAAIDVHDEKPYLLIAYAKGRLILYNYETHQEILSTVIPETDADVTITTVKYSPKCLHLACGCSNGELWMLQPVILDQIYLDPFKFGNDKVMKVAFSHNSLIMAYYDSNNTVFAFAYDTESEDWLFRGKVRSHYQEICNMFFLNEDPQGLYTIGKDRHLIKYTAITNEGDNEEELDIMTRDRIEQKDVPIYFIPYPRGTFSKGGYFLTADEKHKYKIISSRTSMCTSVYLGPAYGCFRGSPVCKMEFLPLTERRYLIFMNKRHIGIQLMPIDGNPFKFVGSLGHPDELLDFQLSHDGKFVFTTGKGDRTVFMWKVLTPSVEAMQIIGGHELQPFYCLLEGGRNGFLYQEMRDLFYYMQILQQGEQISTPRIVSNKINIGELPDLMRACGYYPSEYEIENLMTDLRYKYYDFNGILKDTVTFCEFVRLFINHKPAYGYTIESVEEAFDSITTFADEYGGDDMSREDFLEALTTTGEQVNNEQIYRCLSILLHEDYEQEHQGERDFSFMADTIDFEYLVDEILGLNMDDIQRAETTGGDDEDDDDDGGDYYREYYSRRD